MILDKIVAARTARLEKAKAKFPLSSLLNSIASLPPRPSFRTLFQNQRVNIIAEIKLASPSEGSLSQGRSHLVIAEDYLANQAAALSVLTEPDFFRGDLSHLFQIRERFPAARLLRKDFLTDAYQLAEARLAGADAALLIVRILGREKLKHLLLAAREMQIETLVEVHNDAEMDIALEVGATLIGVNNRDLDSLQIDLDTSRRASRFFTEGVSYISESGIETGAHIKELSSLGFQGFLIGTALLKTPSPGLRLKEVMEEAR